MKIGSPLVCAEVSLCMSQLSCIAQEHQDASTSEVSVEKVTPMEERADARNTKKSNQFVQAQARALQMIPGVNIDADDLKEKPVKRKFHLNPLYWIFGPVIRLEEQTTRLQQQMIKLTGPIAALQPAMLTLQQQVVDVNGQIKGTGEQLGVMRSELHDVRGRMDHIEGGINVTNKQMKGMEKELIELKILMFGMQHYLGGTFAELRKMRPDIALVRSDMGKIREPIMEIQGPLANMAKPIGNLDKQVDGIHKDIRSIREPLQNIQAPITSLDKELGGLHSEITDLRNLLSMILTAMLVSAAITVIGTPLAAILIWRNKHRLLPPPSANQHSEDELVASSRSN